MEKNEDKDFYTKKQLINNLDKILSQITFFLRNCELCNLEEKELNNLIYNHSIYKNRNRVNTFTEKVNNSGKIIINKIIELQEESEMRKKRKNEIQDLKNILNTNIKKLPQEEIKNKLLPPQEEENLNEKNEDDILIEDTKDVEKRKLLQKKKKKRKGKRKGGRH